MGLRDRIRVVHFVDAMGGSDRIFGKEAVVAMLMREQRASGRVEPELLTFTPGRLFALLQEEGFRVGFLSKERTRGLGHALPQLQRRVQHAAPAVIHSHGYRANIVAKTLRFIGRARGVRLVSTCHGWDSYTKWLRMYNALDRYSTVLSDVTTVPDRRMLAELPPIGCHRAVPNGVPDVDDFRAADPPVPRLGAFVVGTLGRITEAKGILNLIATAETMTDPDIVFTVAGDGNLVPRVEEAGRNVRYVGYYDRTHNYMHSLDVYAQASHTEGLSIALLEAMRAGKAIVATDVGATRDAVVNDESALLIPPNDTAALREAILKLREDKPLRERLGHAARLRFESEFNIGSQHRAYLDLYQAGEQR